MLHVRSAREPMNSSPGRTREGIGIAKIPFLSPQFRSCDGCHFPASHLLATKFSLPSHRSPQIENIVNIQDPCQISPMGPLRACNSIYEVHGLQDDTFSMLATKTFLSESSSLVTYTAGLLNALSLLQQKIQQLQTIVQLMAHGYGKPIAQQQAIAAGITSVISQLVAMIADMLQQSVEPTDQMTISEQQLKMFSGGIAGLGFNIRPRNELGNHLGTSFEGSLGMPCDSFVEGSTVLDGLAVEGTASMSGSTNLETSGSQIFRYGTSQDFFSPSLVYCINNLLDTSVRPNVSSAIRNSEDSEGPLMDHYLQGSFEEHDSGMGLRDEDDDCGGENLPPGSYELVEMNAVEILAEHTHFCKICGKGFKRDANLRMHMRGHGDEYKTPAALARPDKSSDQMLPFITVRRFSCPYVGCKRNKKHCKFQPLKTMLCVKNHYRRSHCPKDLICSKCKAKKFSVVADLKTHEKHCGRDKWQCSCGTTFSRKDKLFGHMGLFAGHRPVLLPLQELDMPDSVEVSAGNGSGGFTTANVSTTSFSSNEPTHPEEPANVCFNRSKRLFVGTPAIAGGDPEVEAPIGI